MKRFAYILFMVFVASSCLKKIEGADNLNTNIYDVGYEGGQWFEIVDYYAYQNSDGLDLVGVKAYVAPETTPDLKPSHLHVMYSLKGSDTTHVYSPIKEDKSFEFWFSTTPDLSGSYCLTMGVFMEEDSTGINYFTECFSL